MGIQITRRGFLVGTVAATGAAFATTWIVDPEKALAFSQSPGLRKFAQPLRGVGPAGIPVAAPDKFPAPVTGVTHYSQSMGEFTDVLHPELGPTTLWGYHPAQPLGGGTSLKHLAGIVIAEQGKPVQITYTNNLPARHILPVDTSANFTMAQKHTNMGTVHLHGGFIPWTCDGNPDSWFTPQGDYGPALSFSTYRILNPDLQPGQGEFYYPNEQSARLLWYHDHAHDLTRLNVYAGLASAYIIRDDFERELFALGLPEFIENGGRELPIIIQDKIFVGPDIDSTDPTWPGPRGKGDLWYAHVYDPSRWTLTGPEAGLPKPSVIPEFFGDTMLANGTVYPEATVEAGVYRLRFLNACQARFLNLQLYVDDGSDDAITLNSDHEPTNPKGPDFLVTGTEGGFLPNPVVVPSNVPFNSDTIAGSLITAPAERYDALVDFTDFEGKRVILYNDAPAPFPGGDMLNDYFPGAPGQPTTTTPGFGPNSRQIMAFKVVASTKKARPLMIAPNTDLRNGNEPLPLPLGVTELPAGVPVRRLTLNETADQYGRLIQYLGTDVAPHTVAEGFGRRFDDPATEIVEAGASEVWQIINLTGDTHPIHFHVVNVQIISRQPFDAAHYAGGAPTFTGPAIPPDGFENGWKDTVRVNPNEVINCFMTFTLPEVPFEVPVSSTTGGDEYVWHCHILEHEEHDMMRPLVVMRPLPEAPVTG